MFAHKLLEKLTQVNHAKTISECKTAKDAFAYSVDLKPASYGKLLENFIATKFKLNRVKSSENKGDLTFNGIWAELKISLSSPKFNFVQIRPTHPIDLYILMCLQFDKTNYSTHGELFIFGIPKANMLLLLTKYGQFAHGSKKVHGEVSAKLNDPSIEFALRPKFGSPLWNALLPFRTTIERCFNLET